MTKSNRSKLSEAFDAADAAAFDSVHDNSAALWTPSRRFLDKISSYASGTDRSFRRPANTAAKRAAVILVALIAALSLTVAITSVRTNDPNVSYEEIKGKIILSNTSSDDAFSDTILILRDDEAFQKMLLDGVIVKTSERMSVVKMKPIDYNLAVAFMDNEGHWVTVLISRCLLEEVLENQNSAETLSIGDIVKIAIPVTVRFSDPFGTDDEEKKADFARKMKNDVIAEYGDSPDNWYNAGLIELDLNKEYRQFFDSMRFNVDQSGDFGFVPEADTSYYAVLSGLCTPQSGFLPFWRHHYSFDNDKISYFRNKESDLEYLADYRVIARAFPADGSVLRQLEELKNTQPDGKLSARLQKIYDQNIRLYELIASGEKVLYGSD